MACGRERAGAALEQTVHEACAQARTRCDRVRTVLIPNDETLTAAPFLHPSLICLHTTIQHTEKDIMQYAIIQSGDAERDAPRRAGPQHELEVCTKVPSSEAELLNHPFTKDQLHSA